MLSSVPSCKRVWPWVLRTRVCPLLSISVKVALLTESFTLVAARFFCMMVMAVSAWACAKWCGASMATEPTMSRAATRHGGVRPGALRKTKAGLPYSTRLGTRINEASALTTIATTMNSDSHRCTL